MRGKEEGNGKGEEGGEEEEEEDDDDEEKEEEEKLKGNLMMRRIEGESEGPQDWTNEDRTRASGSRHWQGKRRRGKRRRRRKRRTRRTIEDSFSPRGT